MYDEGRRTTFEGGVRRGSYRRRQKIYIKEEIHMVRRGIHIERDREHMMTKTSIEPRLVCPIRDRCNWSDSGG